MAAQNICFFNKYGFCKYSEKCRKFHEKNICEKVDCEIRECKLRHPKACRYFRDFGFCKFGDWCKFTHKVKGNTVKHHDVKKLEEKLESMEIQLTKKNEKIRNFLSTILKTM